jgi:hypothetical protein
VGGVANSMCDMGSTLRPARAEPRRRDISANNEMLKIECILCRV